MARFKVGDVVRLNNGRIVEVLVVHDRGAEDATDYEIFDRTEHVERTVSGSAMAALAQPAPLVTPPQPASISELSDWLERGTRPGLDFVFKTHGPLLDTFQPTREQCLRFISALTTAVAEEAKTKSDARVTGLRIIAEFVSSEEESCFSGVDPVVFAFQLACRVREPRLINQSKLGLCGVVAVMTHFGRTKPAEFAKYGVDLVRYGRGQFFHTEVSPSYPVLWGYYAGTMPQADIVLVGSLGVSITDLIIGEGADSNEIATMLHNAGYNVQKRIKAIASDVEMTQNIRDAGVRLLAGDLLIVAIDGSFVQALQQDQFAVAAMIAHPASRPKYGHGIVAVAPRAIASNQRKTNHWVAVTELSLTGTTVRIKLYSWTRATARDVPLGAFLTYYGGYISATPPA